MCVVYFQLLFLFRQAVRVLGETSFKKCYEFIKTQRANNVDDSKIYEGLKGLTSHPNDCFLIDQLIFLEEQAR